MTEAIQQKEAIRKAYGDIALTQDSCGCGCGPATATAEGTAKAIGYSDKEVGSVPAGSNLGLGCGNPTGMAEIADKETVLDLGSGAGFDCFLAAEMVGKSGRVIGVDMTPEMITKARENAIKGDHRNVEFRLGEIENLPVADNTIDAIISNCVINLAPDKGRVFSEAYRVLRPGGRITVSDIVSRHELPEEVQKDLNAWAGCVAGAMVKQAYLDVISAAGFTDVSIEAETAASGLYGSENSEQNPAIDLLSITVRAVKPI